MTRFPPVSSSLIIIPIICGDQYKSWSSSLCIFLKSPGTYFLGHSNFSSTLLSNTVSLCSSLNVTVQVAHPYKSTFNVTVLYVFTSLYFWMAKWKTKASGTMVAGIIEIRMLVICSCISLAGDVNSSDFSLLVHLALRIIGDVLRTVKSTNQNRSVLKWHIQRNPLDTVNSVPLWSYTLNANALAGHFVKSLFSWIVSVLVYQEASELRLSATASGVGHMTDIF